jgi:hypothetical protein
MDLVTPASLLVGMRNSQEQLPHWQSCRDLGSPWASTSLHHAHFCFPALIQAHIVAPFLLPTTAWADRIR